MLIGELARRTGCTVQTVRYYEAEGLLPPTLRTEGNQRVYAAEHERRLGFIRHARELGFPLKSIRTMLSLVDRNDRSCAEIDHIARAHLAEVLQRIARLDARKQELERMVAECHGGRATECRIIEALSDQSHEHAPFRDDRPG